MKKLFIIFLFLILVVGCSNGSKSSISQTDLKGYWLQIEEDWSGDVTDLTDNPYAYLKIEDTRLYFITADLENPGYYEGYADKYYILEGNNLYYDYYEFQEGEDWKEKIGSYGGVFEVSFNDDNLVLTERHDDGNDGYDKNTYKKMDKDFVLLEP